MINFLEFYRNIPLHIDPVAFSVGFFSVGWYSLMYIVGFVVVFMLLRYRALHDIVGGKFQISNFKFQIKSQFPISNFQNLIFDFLVMALFGAVVGGRIGYVLLYNPAYYWHHLLEIVSPYDFVSGKFIGIYGMSYHGGLIGVLFSSIIFTKKNKLNFWEWADFVVPAIPAGYFFGRIGNFLNLELYGRVTDSWVGMYFPLSTGAGAFLRFPSQLIEAFLEGAVLFAILWTIRNRHKFSGYFVSVYIIGYGLARFFGEFFREPDEQIGYIFSYFTLGQFFSALMIFAGLLVYYFQRKRKIV